MKDVLLGFAIVLSFAQAPTDPHAGQPSSCSNRAHGTAAVHDCACQDMSDCGVKAPEGPTCAVWCRKDHCHCIPFGGNEEEGLCAPDGEESPDSEES